VQIDLSTARETVKDLAELLEVLDGTAVDEAPTREGARQRTGMSHSLLRDVAGRLLSRICRWGKASRSSSPG
jgi:hypothetical protein